MVPQDRLVQLRSPLSQTRTLSATHMEELHHPRCSHAVLEHEQRTAKLWCLRPSSPLPFPEKSHRILEPEAILEIT